MAIPITIPRLGWNMEQGIFHGWLKKAGTSVRTGESLFTLESEKATEDIECFDNGILHIPVNGPKAGDQVLVGTVIGFLVQAGETAPNVVPESMGIKSEPTALAENSPPTVSSPSVRKLARELGIDLGQVIGTGPGGRILAGDVERLRSASQIQPRAGTTISPRAKRVAGELGIDWTSLQGSGRTGRIREHDVRAATRSRSPNEVDPARQAVTSIRRTIAQRLHKSHHTTAPVTLTTTADATNLVSLHAQFKAAAETGNHFVAGYTDFLVKLSALALRKHPLLNACWADDQITMNSDIHIGIAVDTPAGLLVPVIRDVHELNLKELAGHARDLIDRARQGRLALDEMQGGNFTLTNLGAFGIDAFTPIINLPQCAILGVGRIQRRPVVQGDQVVPRDQITLNLTFDHRIVDGVPAAQFLQTLSTLIENPGAWLAG